MLFLLSPAKSLDYESAVPADLPATVPHFESPRGPSVELIRILRQKSPQDISQLMDLSDKLSLLNVGRYANWRAKSTAPRLSCWIGSGRPVCRHGCCRPAPV